MARDIELWLGLGGLQHGQGYRSLGGLQHGQGYRALAGIRWATTWPGI